MVPDDGATDALDFAPTYGPTETFEAVLDMDRFASGKRFQGTWLAPCADTTRRDDARLIVAYRPTPALLPYVERRVVVTGRRVYHPPMVQQISAQHFTIDDIRLAPGEAPWDPTPDALPLPPLVRDRDGLSRRLDGAPSGAAGVRWVRVAATLRETTPSHPSLDWVDLHLRLADGTTFTTPGGMARLWTPHVGDTITIIAKCWRDAAGALALGSVALYEEPDRDDEDDGPVMLRMKRPASAVAKGAGEEKPPFPAAPVRKKKRP